MTGVLILAGLAKVRRPSATAGALRELSIPSPLLAARILGVGEVVIGIAAIASGARLLWAAVAGSYLAFTLFALWALADASRIGSCGCFGSEDTPITPGHAAFNAAAATVAVLAIVDPIVLSELQLSAGETVIAIALIGAGIALSIAGLTILPRTMRTARGETAPTVREFSLDHPNSH